MNLDLITLKNKQNLQARFICYGARWVSMFTPDKNGDMGDIVLGFDTLSGYCNAGEKYHGAIVGRVCGRISKACFMLNGQKYTLAPNDIYGAPVPNHLHGGISGFHNRIWEAKQFIDINGDEAVTFTYFSKDGEEGYPGNLVVNVTYTLTKSNILRMSCEAHTDKDTIVNLTNHAFFNLSANPAQSILDHTLQLNANAIIECDKELIPIGKLLAADNTPVYFKEKHTIRETLNQVHTQIQKNIGFSIAYALNNEDNTLHKAARLKDEESGRVMEIYTNQPSIQVYTAYFMDGKDYGKNNIPYHASAGIALEPQGYPDAPNHPEFPSVVLNANEQYMSVTEYRFL